MGIFLEKRIVKILNEYNLENEPNLNRSRFVLYITDKKIWPRLNYPLYLYKREKFYRMVDTILGDCIRGEDGYISEDDNGEILLVTKKGRDFIRIPGGFFEEFRKRRARGFEFLTNAVVWAAIGSLGTFIVSHVKTIIDFIFLILNK